MVHQRVLRRLEIRFLEELHRECDFQARRLLEENLVADLDGPTAHLVVARNMLAENLAECPGLILGATLNALFIKERHGVEQPVGLFFSRLPMNADILSAERTALALRGVPDSVAFVAGDKRVLNSVLRLHSFWGTSILLLFPTFLLRKNWLQFFIYKKKKQGVSLLFLFSRF